MESITITRTRGAWTSLAPVMVPTGAKLCPPSVAMPEVHQTWRHVEPRGFQQIPAYAAVQGGALVSGFVADHFSTPRRGPLSCRPPV